MSDRDEQYEALKAAVKSAESKLQNAQANAKKIADELKANEDEFNRKVDEKAQGYKAQTGADFNRIEEPNGKIRYEFTRETTDKERKARRQFHIQRDFDSDTGKTKLSAGFVDSDNQEVKIYTAKDLKKPSTRQKYVTYRFGGIKRPHIEVNNPFLKALGKPIVLPVQATAKLVQKTSAITKNAAEKIADTKFGKGTKIAAKVATAPIVIPAKVVKDIAEKGGVIHAVVDLGDKIVIEGVNTPKPIKAVGNVLKGAALGTESAVTGTATGMGKFSIEITKEKIQEEIHQGISENDGAKAFYIVGMKTAEVYGILAEHTKFRRAVRSDRVANDIKDVRVSRYLADKEETKFHKSQRKLGKDSTKLADELATARSEYEAALSRLEDYEIKTGRRESKTVFSSPDIELTDTEKKIEKTKKKLTKTQQKIDKLEREPVADLKTTVKRLDRLSVDSAMMSMRRKAMRDGGDNAAVEAANAAITMSQTMNSYAQKLHEKKLHSKEEKYKDKLHTLENKSDFESKLSENSSTKAAESSGTSKNKSKKANQNKEMQKQANKKRNQVKGHKQYVEKAAKEAEKLAAKAIEAVTSKAKLGVLAIVLVVLLIFLLCFGFILLLGGGGTTSIIAQVVSPCTPYTLSLCEEYYTELGKNLIEQHQNVKDYYVDYDKYVCLTEIDEITHSRDKLLPFLGTKAVFDNGGEEWSCSDVTPYIDELFNAQYEWYTNEIYEVRNNVTTYTYSNEDVYYSELGTSEYNLDIPEGVENFPELKSEWYSSYATDYTHVEATIMNGYIQNTIQNVGSFTDKDGNTTEYDEAQDITFNNYWEICLVFDWQYEGYYLEYWLYREERQEIYAYDYATLEYAIIENDIQTYDSYWTDTDETWEDNNFDKLIYNRITEEFDDDMKTQFELYKAFLMGHQCLTVPFENPVIKKYPGYNNKIDGDMSLDYSLEFQTYAGQEIICGMDGKITKESDNSFCIYNEDYGYLYYDYVSVPDIEKAVKGEVIATSEGDTLRVTFIDNNGDYINPMFLFST